MIVFFFAGIIIVGGLMFAFISNSNSKTKKINIEHYRTKCLEIEHQLKQDDRHSYQISVLNADKLVDQALKDLGVKGNTMGERMKNAFTKFSDRNGIWAAHKLRNKIAHESDATVTYSEARYALANFRKALKDLGVI